MRESRARAAALAVALAAPALLATGCGSERQDAHAPSGEFQLDVVGARFPLRDIDLGIAIGSAAKTAAIHSIDCRCQTRIAVAARKLGLVIRGKDQASVDKKEAARQRKGVDLVAVDDLDGERNFGV